MQSPALPLRADGRLYRVCPNCIRWPKVCGGNFGHLTHLPRSACRISPHPEIVLPHPRGEIQRVSPHYGTRTCSQQTTCNNQVGRNCTNFAPREKRKKFSEAKT